MIDNIIGYIGGFNPLGTAELRFNKGSDKDSGFLLRIYVDIVDPDCMYFKVDICSGIYFDEVGESYWDGSYRYFSMCYNIGYCRFGGGFIMNSFKVHNGFGFNINKGHTIILHFSDGTISSCGIIAPEVSSKFLN